MASIQNNSFTLLYPDLGLVLGTISGSGTIFTGISGPNTVASSCISVVKNSTGNYTMTIKDFKAKYGVAFGFGTALVGGNDVSMQAATYSGNIMSMVILVTDSAASPVDDTLNVQFWAA